MPRTSTAARITAPLAFLAAATVLVLLVRSAVDSGEPAAVRETVPADTQPAETQPPDPEEAEEPAAPAPPPSETEPPAEASYYVIQSGDTLEAIAREHDTSVERLLELNPGIDPIALTVGERIRLS